MKEKLIIKNFGPIKSVELELGIFNVLIGENATGKSIVAKLLAVCRNFSFIVDNNFSLNAFENGLETMGLSEFIQNDSQIYYDCEHYQFEAKRELEKDIERNEEGIFMYKIEKYVFSTQLVYKTKEFENLLNQLKAIQPAEQQYGYYSLIGWTIPTSFLKNDVAAVVDSSFYMPTERGLQSIFSLGKNSIQNLSDGLFNQLAELDQITRVFNSETLIEPLNITYKNENGKGYIKKDFENKYYSLFNAASGYHSAIPIVLSLLFYSEVKKKPTTFVIEEPELNLFPTAQNKLLQYLVDNTINFGNSILLTTHSPYILTSLNNLMYAFRVGQLYPNEAGKIIEKKNWINPDNVSVYMMLTNGNCEDIFDRDEGLIKAEMIDNVSRILNEQFDSLLNIEYSQHELNTRQMH